MHLQGKQFLLLFHLFEFCSHPPFRLGIGLGILLSPVNKLYGEGLQFLREFLIFGKQFAACRRFEVRRLIVNDIVVDDKIDTLGLILLHTALLGSLQAVACSLDSRFVAPSFLDAPHGSQAAEFSLSHLRLLIHLP